MCYSICKNWDKCLAPAEFSYNNSYQSSLQMAPLKHYTIEGVELLWVGHKLENAKYLGQIELLRQKRKSKLSRLILKWPKPWAGHGGGEVAAAELVVVAWRGKEGSSARGSGSRGLRRCHVRRWGRQEVACVLPRRRHRRSAPAAVKQRGRRWSLDWFAKSEKFKGPTVKLK